MRWLRMVLLCCACLLPSLGRAQAREASNEARQLFVQGVAHARSGQWELAMAAFQSAFELEPRPAVLFNLASAQQRCGKLLASSANYRRFVGSQDPTIPRAHRRSAELLIERIEQRIPRLRVQIEGLREGDRVMLDKTRIYSEELGRDLWLDPGVHTVRIERPKGDAEVRTFAVAEGKIRVLAFRLP